MQQLECEGRLAWVIAFMPEARPVIDHFRLVKLVNRSSFPIYHSKDKRLWLVVSGPGKMLSASATTALYHASGERAGMAWLNLGIAGHRDRDLGSLRWVNKIVDDSSGQKWFPPRIFKMGRRQASALVTVDQPGEYPGADSLVDMEASGFYPIASRYSTRELVQCVKIVSDNTKNSWRDLRKGQVGDWIKYQMYSIAEGAQELLSLSAAEVRRCAVPIEGESMLSTWHFTVTEKHLLFKLLRRHQVLMADQKAAVLCCQNEGVQSAAEALKFLQRELAQNGDEAIVIN